MKILLSILLLSLTWMNAYCQFSDSLYYRIEENASFDIDIDNELKEFEEVFWQSLCIIRPEIMEMLLAWVPANDTLYRINSCKVISNGCVGSTNCFYYGIRPYLWKDKKKLTKRLFRRKPSNNSLRRTGLKNEYLTTWNHHYKLLKSSLRTKGNEYSKFAINSQFRQTYLAYLKSQLTQL